MNERKIKETIRQEVFQSLLDASRVVPEQYHKSLLIYTVYCMLEADDVGMVAAPFIRALKQAIGLCQKDERTRKVIPIFSPYEKVR